MISKLLGKEVGDLIIVSVLEEIPSLAPKILEMLSRRIDETGRTDQVPEIPFWSAVGSSGLKEPKSIELKERLLLKILGKSSRGNGLWDIASYFYTKMIEERLVHVPKDPRMRAIACEAILSWTQQAMEPMSYPGKGIEELGKCLWFLKKVGLERICFGVLVDRFILEPWDFDQEKNRKILGMLWKNDPGFAVEVFRRILEKRKTDFDKKLWYINEFLALPPEENKEGYYLLVEEIKSFLWWLRELDRSSEAGKLLLLIEKSERIPGWVKKEFKK